jgi:hypothetical protein
LNPNCRTCIHRSRRIRQLANEEYRQDPTGKQEERAFFRKEAKTMAKTGPKPQEVHHVSFRMPVAVYRDYAQIAEARGIDFSSLLNWVAVEFRPVLLARHAEYQASMLRAAVVDPQERATEEDTIAGPLARTNDLIRQLQELAAVLREQAMRGGKRRAA